jgi:site-specific DNA recombinase
MFLKIVGIFAEFERENLAERVRLGFERKAKEGDSASGFIQSYGYHREKGQKVQQIFEEEADVVRRIFSMYLHDDYPLSKIGRTLNAANIPTKKGKRWGVSQIRFILRNPNYVGKVRYSLRDESRYFEADGKHEAIIDEATFFEVQDKLSKMKHITRTKRPKSGGYFCGILRCATCGGKYSIKWNYTTKNGQKIPINPCYRCTNSIQGKCPDKRSISHSKIEPAFEHYIANIENFTEMENADLTDTCAQADQKESNAITAEIGQIERKNGEVMDLFLTQQIDFDTYQQMSRRNNDRKAELSARLALLQNLEASRESRHTKKEIVADLRENWQDLDNDQRLQFFQKFIKKMVLRKEESPDVKYGIVVIDKIEFNTF